MYDKLLLLLNIQNASAVVNSTDCTPFTKPDVPDTYLIGRSFYAYATPFILVVGIIGNCLSLRVFLSTNMRKLSASTYLATLSISDMFVLFFYVTVEWLKRGLVYLAPGTKLYFLEMNGFCQGLLFTAYASRFLSPWLVTAFTIERYIGVCHPLHRRYICSKQGSRRIILCILITGCVVVIYKPVLSGVYLSHDGIQYCTASKDHNFVSFLLDSSFALLITFIPFMIISVLNVLIMRKMCMRNSKFQAIRLKTAKCDRRTISSISCEESVVRLEFTLILFTISFCFVTFNAPYFIVWLRNFLHNKHVSRATKLLNHDMEYWQGILYITRTIFYMNYSVNFFLYSISGRSFRRELTNLFTCKRTMLPFRSWRLSPTHQSWV